jgi:hypothetical protein
MKISYLDLNNHVEKSFPIKHVPFGADAYAVGELRANPNETDVVSQVGTEVRVLAFVEDRVPVLKRTFQISGRLVGIGDPGAQGNPGLVFQNPDGSLVQYALDSELRHLRKVAKILLPAFLPSVNRVFGVCGGYLACTDAASPYLVRIVDFTAGYVSQTDVYDPSFDFAFYPDFDFSWNPPSDRLAGFNINGVGEISIPCRHQPGLVQEMWKFEWLPLAFFRQANGPTGLSDDTWNVLAMGGRNNS